MEMTCRFWYCSATLWLTVCGTDCPAVMAFACAGTITSHLFNCVYLVLQRKFMVNSCEIDSQLFLDHSICMRISQAMP